MPYLLDTGILLRLFDRTHSEFPTIRGAVRALKARGQRLFTTQQNIAEFWNVSTRPLAARGGFGLPGAMVNLRVAFIERLCTILASDEPTYAEWKQIVLQHGVIGVAVHDARLVAAMRVYRVSHILTLNPQDFRRYPGITVVEPRDVLASP